MSAVTSLRGQVGVAAACQALSLPRSSFYRRLRARPRPDAPRRSPRALTAWERQAVLDLLHEPRFVDKAAHEVYALLLDEGRYLCAPRTMYRILAAHDEVRERRHQARHPAYVKPELLATAPNQVWSWDITRLQGVAKWTYFYLYVILDIFSRYVVGWMIAERENARLARRLIAESVQREAVDKHSLILHSDRGAPMKAQTTAQLLAYLGVAPSFSRPQVSNDNPYSEAQFRTAKYHPTIPGRYGSLQHAREVYRPFFDWYNHEHRHSGISYLTPAMIPYGQGQAVVVKRAITLAGAYAAHPERFVRGAPKPKAPPTEVWINPPAEASSVPRSGGSNAH